MIKRGNLIFAVLIFGILPLLAAIVVSYWLVARTTGDIQAQANKVVIEKTQEQLREVTQAKKAAIENHLEQVEYRLADFASEPQVVYATNQLVKFTRFNSPSPQPVSTIEGAETFQPIVNSQVNQLKLSNVLLCDPLDGQVLYSFHPAANDTDPIPADQAKLRQLFRQYLLTEFNNNQIVAMPFEGNEYESYDHLTYICSPIKHQGRPIALAVFELSMNNLNTLVAAGHEHFDCNLVVNDAENIAVTVDSGQVSSIAEVAQDWNLTVIATADQHEALSEISAVTQKGSVLTLILFGSSQAATLWTVFFVIACGTLVVNHLKKPLEKTSEVLEQISLEGSGLLMDRSINEDRSALLKWCESVVQRTDLMVSHITGQRQQNADIAATAIAQYQNVSSKQDDKALREVVLRSQRSLASAVEAARLAESAIAKLGTECSPEEIHGLREVVSNINEQSKWLYENSSWMEETSSPGILVK